MKSEKLMDCIGQIDDRFIIEADSLTNEADSIPAEAGIQAGKIKRVRRLWTMRASAGVAAAACIIIAMSLLLNQPQQTGPDDLPDHTRPTDQADLPDLPKLPVNTELGSFGFEGYLAYDISELRNGNPWTENNDLAVMPVFANPHEYDGAGAPVSGLSPEELLAEAEKIADLFGLEITSLYTEPTMEEIERIIQKMEAAGASEEEIRQNANIYRATAECNGAKIRVEKDGHIDLSLDQEMAHLAEEIGKLSVYESFRVSFDFRYKTTDGAIYFAGLPLPDGYRFTYANTSYEQALEATQYLLAEYGGFMGIKTPGYDLAADYTFSGDLNRIYTSAFENAGSLTDRILNYNFRRLYFSATDLGGLGSIMYYNADLSQKIGDYPVITAEEARKLLLEKHYITSVPEELPGEEYIARVELIYRTGRLDTVFMPYYRFLVEMPSMEMENGLKTFGAFYVPAVRSEYLENLPVWDGRFN